MSIIHQAVYCVDDPTLEWVYTPLVCIMYAHQAAEDPLAAALTVISKVIVAKDETYTSRIDGVRFRLL